jgi:cysteinyl-tRNA synthetase
MFLKIFNSLNHQLEEFRPIKNKTVGLYTCGPTVYNYAHIGNLRAYVFEDILKRILMANDYKVKHVMNITDVGHLTSDADVGEDKMEKGSRREGKTAWEIAKFYITAFEQDIADLNILSPDIWCRATEYIKEQIQLIQKLEENGFTYQTSDGIYFDTSKFPNYGKMANLKNQEIKAGARVDLGEKKNPTDFALWKFSPTNEKRQMEWESPWGVGFPGWHIECSAMSVKHLGQPFDIHCGGIDHIPVHHINEIAQSEAANGKPLANYWLHGEFLITGKEKMAKSGDNFLTLATIKEKNINPLAYRYFLLQTHYRKQLNFSWEALQAAQNGLNHLKDQIAALGTRFKAKDGKVDEDLKREFLEKINDDLNLPQALVILQKTLKSDLHEQNKLATIKYFDKVFGLKLDDIKLHGITINQEAQDIIAERDAARAQKNWAKSDDLRKVLEDMGYKVEDTTGGTKVIKNNGQRD